MKRPRLARLLLEVRFDPPMFAARVMLEADGSVHSVPYHRVREDYRDGELIWQRPEPPEGMTDAGSFNSGGCI